MKKNISKFVTKGLISIFMGYLLIRFLFLSLDYAFNWVDKFYAYVIVELKFNEKIDKKEFNKFFSHKLTSISHDPVSKNIIIKRQAKSYQDLAKIQAEILEKVKNKFPEGSYELIKSERNPQPVSDHFFRLQMTVYIPAFIMAVLWFFHVYRWYNEEIKESKQKVNPNKKIN